MIKPCSRCAEEKQYPEDFPKTNTKKKDGSNSYRSYCKTCSNKLQIEYKTKTRKNYTPHGTPKENLINKIFGKLTVIEYYSYKQFDNSKRHVWLCKCECGNEKKVQENYLKSGHVQTCGCSRNRRQKDSPLYKGYKDISMTIWNKIKRSAKKRNHEFNISIKYAWELFEKQNNKCALSGLYINFSDNRRENHSASLDRIDSTKGYIKDNVQWVHKDVNIIKQFYSQNYFIFLCSKIADNNK